MPRSAGASAETVNLTLCGGTEFDEAAVESTLDARKDHFINYQGVACAGRHLIIDLFGASRLDELDTMEAAMREAVELAGATLLHIHLHHFDPNGGISGVAVLAESHISVHTWPENDYAAFDVFMCGDAQPQLTVDIFKRVFGPERTGVRELLRGVVSDD